MFASVVFHFIWTLQANEHGAWRARIQSASLVFECERDNWLPASIIPRAHRFHQPNHAYLCVCVRVQFSHLPRTLHQEVPPRIQSATVAFRFAAFHRAIDDGIKRIILLKRKPTVGRGDETQTIWNWRNYQRSSTGHMFNRRAHQTTKFANFPF